VADPAGGAIIEELVAAALAEDLGEGDVTTAAVVPRGMRARAWIVAKEPLVLAGMAVAERVFARVDPTLTFAARHWDGDRVAAGGTVAEIEGEAASILGAERTALNFLQHLSGIATLTAAYVAAVAGFRVVILDTRKTLPGLRLLEKAAVRAGGGSNHRMGLYDAVLIKDNHIALAGGVAEAVRRARARSAGPVEIEVSTPAQVEAALAAGAEILLLDNMDAETLEAAVRAARGRAVLEASGNMTLERIRAVAAAGVDRISVGALTHSAPAADLALRLVPDGEE